MARSWYINECSSVLVGAKWCVWAKVLASDSWNVAYGEMSSEVSERKRTRQNRKMINYARSPNLQATCLVWVVLAEANLSFYCTWNLFADIPEARALVNRRVVPFARHCIRILLALHRLLAKSLVLPWKEAHIYLAG